MAFEDKTIVCEDCGQEFLHSAEDQERYAERGFTNDPKRCRPCRERRKSAQQERQSHRPAGGGGGPRGRGRPQGAGMGRGGGGGGRGRGDRPRRESHEVQCAACGAMTTVPFKPTQDRPVYCRDCYRALREGS